MARPSACRVYGALFEAEFPSDELIFGVYSGYLPTRAFGL